MRTLVFALFTLSLCRGVVGRQEPPPPPPPTEPAPAPMEVSLIEPGAEPRKQLRMSPTVGHEQTARMRLLMSVSTKMGDRDMPAPPMPPMLLTMRVKVAEVSPAGDVAYDMAITECRAEDSPDSPPGMAEMLNSSMAVMSKVTGRWTVTNRGLVKNVKFALPDDASDQAKAMMSNLSEQVSQLAAPLPEEPVGIGAKWRVKAPIKAQQLKIDQIMTYTLTDVRDGSAFMDMAIEQSAKPQPIENASLPPGAAMELESLKSTGDGKVELPLNGIIPSRLTSKVTTDLAMMITQGGTPSKVNQSVKLSMSWDRVEPTATTPTAPPPSSPPTTPSPGTTPPPPPPPSTTPPPPPPPSTTPPPPPPTQPPPSGPPR